MYINKVLVKNLPINNLFFSEKTSKLYFYTNYGIKIINLPTLYFYKFIKKGSLNCGFTLLICNISDNFLLRWLFKKIFSDLFLFKLRIRGLGYRLRSISDFFHYVFFNYTNYFYIYNPLDILIKTYRKRMILISFFWDKLRLLICHILLLQEIGPYTLQGIRWTKQIVILKKSGKKI